MLRPAGGQSRPPLHRNAQMHTNLPRISDDSVHSAGRSRAPPLPKLCVLGGGRKIWGGGIRSAQNWEQELLVFLRVHIFPRDEDAGNLNEIVGLLAVCHANGLLDGHVAHVERPLRDNGLNDVLL